MSFTDLDRYKTLLACSMVCEKTGDTIMEDQILDEMDGVWKRMASDEREEARRYGRELFALNGLAELAHLAAFTNGQP